MSCKCSLSLPSNQRHLSCLAHPFQRSSPSSPKQFLSMKETPIIQNIVILKIYNSIYLHAHVLFSINISYLAMEINQKSSDKVIHLIKGIGTFLLFILTFDLRFLQFMEGGKLCMYLRCEWQPILLPFHNKTLQSWKKGGPLSTFKNIY